MNKGKTIAEIRTRVRPMVQRKCNEGDLPVLEEVRASPPELVRMEPRSEK